MSHGNNSVGHGDDIGSVSKLGKHPRGGGVPFASLAKVARKEVPMTIHFIKPRRTRQKTTPRVLKTFTVV